MFTSEEMKLFNLFPSDLDRVSKSGVTELIKITKRQLDRAANYERKKLSEELRVLEKLLVIAK